MNLILRYKTLINLVFLFLFIKTGLKLEKYFYCPDWPSSNSLPI